MTDRREDILARLVNIGGALTGIVKSARNIVDLSDFATRPAVIVYDGDEEASEAQLRPGHRGMAPNLVTMTPTVTLLATDTSANVGSALNTLRTELIFSVLSDSDLASICGPNGAVRYMAAATAVSKARQIEGEMGVSFAITYPLIPSELVTTA